MPLGPGSNSDFSSLSSNEAGFEQLLRLSASYGSPQSFAPLAREDARAGARQNPFVVDIATRAYHIYLERGAAHGHDLDDWLQAERQVLDGLKKNSLRVALAFGLSKDSPRR